jgi:hypothetical protein
MNNFKTIDYSLLLFENLRNYFSINSQGSASIAYKYLASFVQPMQTPFNDFDSFRVKEALIASCKWQIGQLTNVLNHFYDPILKRIYISQSTTTVVSDPIFAYPPVLFDSDFGTAPMKFEKTFLDVASKTNTTINIPSAISSLLADITATLNQVNLTGIPYTINIY